MMKIEIWSDYVCPFCYIGKRRLEHALQATGLDEQVEVEMKSFLLDPSTPEDSDEHVVPHLAQKYGVNEKQAREMVENVAQQAKTVGLDYNIDGMRQVNTLKAHRLAKLANQEGVASKVNERLLHDYFIEGKHIGKMDVLLEVAEDCGIERQKAEEVLNADDFTQEVQADLDLARQFGVQGVPFFVINRKYAISGAQPLEAFENALRKVAEEVGIQPKLSMLNDDESGICTDDNCNI